MADLSKLRQLSGEFAKRYLSRFKREMSRYYVALPKIEFVKLTMNGLEIELRKKFEGMESGYLFELCSRATRYE